MPSHTPIDFHQLALRMGEDMLRRRLMLQARQEAEDAKQSLAWIQDFHSRIEAIFKFFHLYSRGKYNATHIQIFNNTLYIPNLPKSFSGFKILQLADLHLDIDPSLPDAVLNALENLDYDLAVITGDFRCRTVEDYYPAIESTKPVIQALKKPALAVLGNHDPIEIIPELEASGLRFLLNEAYPLYQQKDCLWILGIDDPHFYKTYDLAKLCHSLPKNACSLLLAHSPEIAPEADTLGISSVLAGHTHGGQICLPFGIPLSTNLPSGLRRSLVRGNWQWGKVHGYTSRGTGCCGVPIRFNCPAEITLHTLQSFI